ncbi:MAG: methyltransferase domain-containing protein [Micromonosporaceae bacterium]|nr:methyltransferase domain-containing protein [Micromonosporaceae bacterium]
MARVDLWPRLLGVECLAVGPHAAPRTAVIWAVLREELARIGRPVVAVDVGGGTGGFAVPLARDGHVVTVVDASPDALAALTRRAADAGVADRIEAVQGDVDDLVRLLPPDSADLVLCHSLLEVVDDPADAVAALAACLRRGGVASVVVANRVAAVLARAVAGQLRMAADLVCRGVDEPQGAAGPAPGLDRLGRRFDASSARRLLDDAGFEVEAVHGVRVVADLVPGAIAEAEQEQLLAFELAASAISPYREIATQLHLLARRR